MAKRSLLAIALVFFMILMSVSAWAVMPTVLSYQGKLTDTSGVPVPDGTYQVRFFFYDDVTAGTKLWEEQQNVPVADGIYSVHLGYTTAFPATFFAEHDDLYLEVHVYNSSTTNWETLSPRQQVVCNAFSMKAQYAEKALDGSITTVMLATDAVTDEKIKDETVTAADIKNGSVLAIDIQDGQVLQEILDDDGAGSGLDADRLDGLEASAFMSSGADNWVDETGDTMTGNLNVQASVNATNSGTTYAGEFRQTGGSNNSGALYARTTNGRYGEYLSNEGGYTGGLTFGLYADTLGNSTSTYNTYGVYGKAYDSNSPTYGLYADTDSESNWAYGAYLGTYSTSSGAVGINAETSNGSVSTSLIYGLRNWVNQHGSGSGAHLYGLYNYGNHHGTSGTAYGIISSTYGSDTGDAFGAYFSSNKPSTDTDGTAYGGHFIGDNDRPGGVSYGLYTEATGANGPRYGLYSNVTTSGANSYENYGVYSNTSTLNGNVYGYYALVDNDGTSGSTIGNYSYAYSSDEGSAYGGFFIAVDQASTDSGSRFGVYAYTNNNEASTSYALYGAGGDYAGWFNGRTHVDGTFTATSKSFVQPHKTDPKREIVYVSLEGPEHAVFIRGNANLKNGKATIEMPEEWQQVAAEEGITVNLTPIGSWAPLYAESVSKSKVIVQVAKGGDKDASFSYYIMAKRDGFQEHEAIQENKHFTADGISAWQFESRYEEDSLETRAIGSMLKSNGILNADGKLNESTASTLGWKVVANEEDPSYREAHGMTRLEVGPEGKSPPPRPSHPEPEEVKPPERPLKLSRQHLEE